MIRKTFVISIVILFVLLWTTAVYSQEEARGFYAPMWMIKTPPAVETIIAKARQYHFNQVYVQVRGRGDAYYYPNRDDTAYQNNEPRAELYDLTPTDFDPLQHAIDLAHNGSPRIEIHAWMVVYPAWNRDYQPSSPAHVYRQHPEWITEDSSGITQNPTGDAEGAYLDPGIPAVQDYLINVFMDVVRNYDVDGIHLDYIRYHTGDWGYDPLAKAYFEEQTGWNIDADSGIEPVWHNWKRAQISTFVERLYHLVHAEKPWVQLSGFLPSFTDTVINNYQAYNWWSHYEWMDVLQRGSYNNSVSLVVNRYNHTQNYNYGGLPVQCPLGSEDCYSNTPESMVDIINALRSATPAPHGYNHFQYSGLSADNDERFKYLGDSSYNPDAPYATAVAVPSDIPDTQSPNAPASASASSSTPGQVNISFQRPMAASDGDYPVQYRIYRDDDSNVELYYDNLEMVFYDDPPVRTSFTWTDVDAPSGSTYYKIVAYDDYFNQNSVTVSANTVALNIIVDNSDPGFSVESGTWYTGTSAPDRYGADYRWNSVGAGNDKVQWRPSIPQSGQFDVAVWYPEGSNRAPDAKFTVYFDGGNQTFVINQQTNGGQWNLLGTFQFSEGTSGFVELSDHSGSSENVVVADAVRFTPAGSPSPEPWETKPLATPVPHEHWNTLVIDNTPEHLHYEDGSGWASSSYGNVYNDDKRYASSPTTSKANYLVYIPRRGMYALDGWIQGNSAYAQHARYRFVDADGIVQESITSQQHSGSINDGDFWINVDGVDDSAAFIFEKGFLFITLFNTNASDGYTIADALRLRYLGSDADKNEWLFY